MMEKIQRFGGAMFTPVLLFSFAGLMVSIAIVAKNPLLVGSIATEGTTWHSVWSVIENGAWTVFNQMELLFVIGLPIGLAKKANARAAMEAFVVYLTFQYFINSMLTLFQSFFKVDMLADAGNGTGLKLIAGIKTLDTSIVGAILISAIVVYLHNRFFDVKLPDFLGVFQGSSLVVIVGFFAMLPVAFITCIVWPQVQVGIGSMQNFLANAGVIGVWIYTFLERILIPTGLHHFIWTPFILGPAVVENGITKEWVANLPQWSQGTTPLIQLFPAGGFALHGMSKIFGSVGIAGAFYMTAKEENKKRVSAVLIPATLTAVLAGVTEPLEFTFLFISPALFLVHSILAATLSATMYAFGVVGDMGGGLIDLVTKNWIPLLANHGGMILTQIVIGLIFTGIYFIVFKVLIEKFDFKTPGREETEVKLYTKKDYKAKNAEDSKHSEYADRARIFLDALGGAENVTKVNNCATRLRITVADEAKVQDDHVFKAGGAHGVVRKGSAIQVIVGLDVPQVKDQFEILMIKEAKD